MADSFKITKDDLSKLQHGTKLTGNILCINYDIKLQKNGQEYVTGTLHAEKDIQFKVWGSNTNLVNEFKTRDLKGKVINIDGEGNSYNGTISVILNDIGIEGITNTPDDFLIQKYDIDAYFKALSELVKATTSEQGFALATRILFNNTELNEQFKKAYAAISHHDNCRGGLLAHTFKVVRLMAFCTEQYPNMFLAKSDNLSKDDKKDLLIIGCLLHDLGKVVEMNMGVYQPEAVAKHGYLGIEILYAYKNDICGTYSDQWWYTLCSILLQHHGEYGEKPASLAAYFVHMIDLLDSRFTYLTDMIANSPEQDKIFYDDMILNVLR